MSPAQEQRIRPPRRAIDGVLLLDKAVGISSNHALQAARRLFGAAKAGHTGTLDPLASGLLPVCFGEATKFSGELLDADKRYLATVQLGITTDTADAEGRILERRHVNVTLPEVEAVLAGFLGESEQVPPMYSALKRDGKPLYEYARAGVEVERKPRRVLIREIALVPPAEELASGRFSFSVLCSKGTYVRTLAADIGERLGCGAHLAALRRTGIGRLDVASASTHAELEMLSAPVRDTRLLPVDALLADLARIDLAAAEAARLCHGQEISGEAPEGTRVRAYGPDGGFIGVCKALGRGRLQPVRLVASA